MAASARSAARFQVLAGGLAPEAPVFVVGAPAAEAAPARRFGLGLAAGRFVELSGVGAPLLTVALGLVYEAQQAGENVAWVAASAATFYAPDAALVGIDLAALPVVLAPRARSGPEAVLAVGRAASHLLRSGAFGLVVLDLAGLPAAEVELPTPLLSRLTGLAQKHGTALVALTRKALDQPSLGSLVSLHATAARGPIASAPDGHPRVAVTVTATKDKRHGPGWSHTEHYRAPDGIA